MLIARVYATVQVYQVRGHQYKDRGHVVWFDQNMAHTYEALLQVPEESQVISSSEVIFLHFQAALVLKCKVVKNNHWVFLNREKVALKIDISVCTR